MKSQKQSNDRQLFSRLSRDAIRLIGKAILLPGIHYEIYATSAVPISNWLTYDYYVYSCLFANRCCKLERILLSDKSIKKIRANHNDRNCLITTCSSS